MTTHQAVPTTLLAVLKAALPGDVVEMTGVFDRAKVTGIKSTEPGIIIRPSAAGANFTGYTVFTDCAWLTIDGFDVTETAGTTALAFLRCANVRLVNCNVHGAMKGVGVVVNDSSDVTLDGNDIHHLGAGISAVRNARLTITENSLHDLQSDGCQVVDHKGGLTFSGNASSDFYPAATDHPDVLQVRLSSAATGPATDILIEDNFHHRGKGGIVQGLFVTASATFPSERVTIRGNAMLGTMYHGILAASAVDPLIEDNLVIGYKDMTSWLGVRNPVALSGGRVRGNTATSFNNFSSLGVESGGNTVTPQADEPDALRFHYTWQKRHETPADPKDAEIEALKAELATLKSETAADLDAAAAKLAAMTSERDALAAWRDMVRATVAA